MLGPGVARSLGGLFHACQHIDGSSRGVGANNVGVEILSGSLCRGADLRNLIDQVLNRLPDGSPRSSRGGAPRHRALDTGNIAGKYLRHHPSPGNPLHTFIQGGYLARVGKSAISGCSILIGIPNAIL
jgi:hypothetical protein